MKQLLIIGIATFLSLLVLGCGKKELPIAAGPDEHAGEEHAKDITLTPEAAKIAGIEIETASNRSMQAELKVPGVVTNTSQGKAVVTPPAAGKVTRLFVKVGDRVKARQPIAMIQSPELADSAANRIEAQRDLASAQATVREALSELELSKSQLNASRTALERQKQFATTGAFSQPGLHQAQKDLNEAETELQEALQEQVVHQAQFERAERLFKQELISRSELEEARLEAQKDKLREDKAKRQIEIAKAVHERESSIAKRGLMNSKEIQTAEAEVRSASLGVEHARIKYRSAVASVRGGEQGLQAARVSYGSLSGNSRATSGTITVTAPISGVVTELEATLGQALERTSEICHIENLRSVWVTASVSERDIGKVSNGAMVQVTVKAFPSRIFDGVVQVVGSRLDAKSRTMPVQVLVDNSDGALRADMFATVSLGIGKSESVLSVRRSAIVEKNGEQRTLYVAEDGGKFEERIVELGRTQGEYVEVTNGLEKGAKVVTKGAFILKSEKSKADLQGHED